MPDEASAGTIRNRWDNEVAATAHAGGMRLHRRDMLALMGGAGAAAALYGGDGARARAQGALGPTYATDITAELKKLAPNVYAYVQREAVGQSNLSISNCGIVAGADSLLAVDATSAPIQAKRFIAVGQQVTGKRFKRVIISHHHPDRCARRTLAVFWSTGVRTRRTPSILHRGGRFGSAENLDQVVDAAIEFLQARGAELDGQDPVNFLGRS